MIGGTPFSAVPPAVFGICAHSGIRTETGSVFAAGGVVIIMRLYVCRPLSDTLPVSVRLQSQARISKYRPAERRKKAGIGGGGVRAGEDGMGWMVDKSEYGKYFDRGCYYRVSIL